MKDKVKPLYKVDQFLRVDSRVRNKRLEIVGYNKSHSSATNSLGGMLVKIKSISTKDAFPVYTCVLIEGGYQLNIKGQFYEKYDKDNVNFKLYESDLTFEGVPFFLNLLETAKYNSQDLLVIKSKSSIYNINEYYLHRTILKTIFQKFSSIAVDLSIEKQEICYIFEHKDTFTDSKSAVRQQDLLKLEYYDDCTLKIIANQLSKNLNTEIELLNVTNNYEPYADIRASSLELKSLFTAKDIIYFRNPDSKIEFCQKMQKLIEDYTDEKLQMTIVGQKADVRTKFLPNHNEHISKLTLPHLLIDSGTDLEEFLEQNKSVISSSRFNI